MELRAEWGVGEEASRKEIRGERRERQDLEKESEMSKTAISSDSVPPMAHPPPPMVAPFEFSLRRCLVFLSFSFSTSSGKQRQERKEITVQEEETVTAAYASPIQTFKKYHFCNFFEVNFLLVNPSFFSSLFSSPPPDEDTFFFPPPVPPPPPPPPLPPPPPPPPPLFFSS